MNRPFRLTMQELSDRIVPASLVDLTRAGAEAAIGGAIVRQADAPMAGELHSFVRLQADGVQQGYNTSHRPLQFDERPNRAVTRDLKLSEVPVVTVNGVNYREFILDINQLKKSPNLSLDVVRIYTSDFAGLSRYRANTLTLGNETAKFDLDASHDYSIMLNGNLNRRDGKGDMVLLVPASAFAGVASDDYVYLYSKFGGIRNGKANGGVEEWSVRDVISEPPPPPPSVGTSSLSGMVYYNFEDDNFFDPSVDTALGGVTITLQWIDGNGNTMERTTQTGPDGTYRFDNLFAGSYTIIETQPDTYLDGTTFVGSLGGDSDFNTFIGIPVGDNESGTGYDFTERLGD